MKRFAEKTLLVLLVITLSVTAISARGETAPKYPARTQYMAVILDGKKVGHAISTFKIENNKAITNMMMKMVIARGSAKITVVVDTTETETSDGKPLGFAMTVNQGQMVNRGKIGNDGNLNVTMTVGGMTKQKTLPWPKDALMSHGRMIREHKAGLKPGTKITNLVFDPSTMKTMTATSVIGEKVKVDLLGRVVMLTEVKTAMQSSAGKINTTSYVNDSHIPLKSITPMIGMKIELIDCSKSVAMASNETIDLMSKTILPSPTTLSKKARSGPLVYTIKPLSSESNPAFLNDANQSMKTASDKTITLTIRPTPAPKNAALPYKGKDPAALKALKPSDYVQSDHKLIRKLAKEAIGNATDAATAAKRIEKFVRKHIKTKNLSVGYASAVEVAQSREGDCTEHAVLTAALCRAAGIPAQVINGFAYIEQFGTYRNIFGPHAWNRVFIGGKWVGIDSALKGFDTGHIALSSGDGIGDDMLKAANTIGNIKIVTVKTVKTVKKP
ncbi:MAG: hypothetical protein GY794_13975 [bacterium]|nr:hypothetical protein [bacterium]